jgi:uncharacterized membrane protein
MSLSLPVRQSILWAVRVLSTAAMVVCLWLFQQKLSGGISSLAGCGDGDGCGQVMGGAWSEWFHIPVTLLAALIYAGVLVLTFPTVQQSLGRTGDQLLAAAGVILAGAAVYFLSILHFVEEKNCPWCLGLHLTGLTVGALILITSVSTQRAGGRGIIEAALLSGLMAMGVLSAGQIWGPKPQSHLVTSDGMAESGASAATAKPSPGLPVSTSVTVPPAPAAGATSRMVSFFDGNLKFDAEALPLLGSPGSRVILVEFFDYTCKSCRALSGDFKELKKKWPDTFGLIVLPAPLNRSCNPFLKPGVEDHPFACELARLSLTLWRARPEAFAGFHDYLMGLPLPMGPEAVAAARATADELAGAEAMKSAAADPWIEKQLEQNLGIFARLTSQTNAMPKLLLHSSVMMHGAARDTPEFISVMEKQFDLTGTGSPVIAHPR